MRYDIEGFARGAGDEHRPAEKDPRNLISEPHCGAASCVGKRVGGVRICPGRFVLHEAADLLRPAPPAANEFMP